MSGQKQRPGTLPCCRETEKKREIQKTIGASAPLPSYQERAEVMSQSHHPMALITVRSDETLETLFKKTVGKSLTLSPSLYPSPLPFFQSLFLSRRPPIKHRWSGKWGRLYCLAITLGIGFLSDRSARAWQRHLLSVLTICVCVCVCIWTYSAEVWRQICP